MTNDRNDVPRSPHATSPNAAHDEATTAGAAHDDDEQTTSAHFGAVEGETSPVIPPMHESSDDDDAIDPADEITPG